jgi:integrase/recombinase XerD
VDRLAIASLKPSELTWETALRLFALRNRSQNIAAGTQELYGQHLSRFREWVRQNGNTTPAQISAQDLRAFIESRQAKGNKPTTVDCCFRILRTFWGFLLRDGLIISNPMDKVERPRRERRFVKPFTPDQFKLLLEAIDTSDALGYRDYALTVFLADTGLRIGEALSLKLTDVDWAGGSALVLGKGRKERRVAFGQTARKVLMGWIRRRGVLEGSDWLWVNRMGAKMERRNFAQRLKKHTRKAGIAADHLGAHACRHFFALSFLRNGGGAFQLQRLLGHASLEMVRTYANMTDDDALQSHRTASPLDKMGPLPNERKQVRLK